MKSNTLGKYIERFDRRNSENEFGLEDVRGISNTKEIMTDSRANLIGRDFSKLTILKDKEFIFNRRTSRNGERISLGYNNLGYDFIITEDYVPFRIKEEYKKDLLSDYLYLFFLNPEFDRYARFNSWGSATEFFNWEDMCNVPFELPDISVQKQIISQYKDISEQITSLENLNDSLVKLLDNIYNDYFSTNKRVLASYMNGTFEEDMIDEEWKIDEAQKFFKITIGKTPPREIEEYFTENPNDIKWISIADMKTTSPYVFDSSEYLTEEAVKDCNVKLVNKGAILVSFKLTVGRVAIVDETLTTNEAIARFEGNEKAKYYTYLLLRNYDYQLLGSTSSISTAVNSKIIKSMPFILPDDETLDDFNSIVSNIFDELYIVKKSIDGLKKLKNIIASEV